MITKLIFLLHFSGFNEEEIFPYPIIEDKDRSIAMKLGMVDKDELDAAGMALTARAIFVLDPKKKFRLSLLYPATTGRNFELVRIFFSFNIYFFKQAIIYYRHCYLGNGFISIVYL